jgi:hypothetical protein
MYIHLKVGMEKLKQSLFIGVASDEWEQAAENLGTKENQPSSKAFGIQR